MENKEEAIQERPPFFKKWKGLYLFLIAFEVGLILFFIWITNAYS